MFNARRWQRNQFLGLYSARLINHLWGPVKKCNKLVVGTLASVLFGCCTTFAGEVGRTAMTLTVVDDFMKPVSGVTISGSFTKGIESGGFFSSSTTEEVESVKCVTDDSGVCRTAAPLTKDKNQLLKLSGKIGEISLPSGTKLELNEKNRTIDTYIFSDKTFDRRIYIEGDKARLGGKWTVVPIADVKAKLSVIDDDLETEVKIDTQRTRTLWTKDNEISDITFIRAWINKTTGNRRFQIYSHIDYDDPDWRFYSTVNFQTPSGPQSAILTKIAAKPYHWGKDLRHSEDVGFEIPEALLRELAGKYIDGSDAALKFRLFAKTGRNKDFSIPVFEIAGLLLKVDELVKKAGK